MWLSGLASIVFGGCFSNNNYGKRRFDYYQAGLKIDKNMRYLFWHSNQQEMDCSKFKAAIPL